MNIFLILPTQLFKDINILKNYDLIYLIEESYYFNPTYHKQKLTLHIASMNYYYEYLNDTFKNKIRYITYNNVHYDKLFKKSDSIFMYNPIDNKMLNLFKMYNINFIDTPLFLNTEQDLINYKNTNIKNTNIKNLKKQNKKHFSQSDFYKYQRIKHNILIDSDNKPLYGKWSFDTENRHKFHSNEKELKIPIYNIKKTSSCKYLQYASHVINNNFKHSYGELNNSYYPCTHIDAINHLNYFIKYKIKFFGKYQDAISSNIIYGYHTNISALLNIGLLTPKQVISTIIKYFNKAINKKEIISSIEGLIRQIIGWREYMHFIYKFYSKDIIKINYINCSKSLSKDWFEGTTELTIVNNLIKKVQEYAYLHHIERLMIINNLMYLYQIKFKDIYKWFMTCFIDSYDWVMVPNILMNINSLDSNIKYMTRVYISSDNYIKKMSNYNNKSDFEIINRLYWNFIKTNKHILKKDYGLASQVSRIL